MRELVLKPVEHQIKIGQKCGDIDPNVTEDSLFLNTEGEVVGFYINKLKGKIADLLGIANNELLSTRVPKTEMRRSSGMFDAEAEVKQFSTILGSVPPKPHMRRPYATISSVHNVPSAETFVKSMLLLCHEAEEMILKISPELFKRQQKLINENVPEQFKFGRLFTSSISNYNIAAPFHRDAGNLVGCVNVILAKKKDATGGNTTVPDYGATVDSCDNSMLVYPAWQNVHGVTPIVPTRRGGYRNSLVFYPLKAFKQFM